MGRVTLLTKIKTPMHPPKPFFHHIKQVKAILLGADPSNNSNKGKIVQLEYVFGIGEKDKRYFAGIKKNLTAIGLKREDIYAQNLVQDYQTVETGKNKNWKKAAEPWVEVLKQELYSFDPGRKNPVLVTARVILEVLSLKLLPAAKTSSFPRPKVLLNPNKAGSEGRSSPSTGITAMRWGKKSTKRTGKL
jgi:hypothetical protein